jgi:predicted ATP-grasp superfamily ATP-dependent carboligase
MGGLDKAELFEYLVQTDCEHIIAPTLTLNSPADAENAWSRFDGDCVVKPSLKPWSMEMREMPGKALMTSTFSDFADFEKKLKACWHYSRQWVVQPRLYTPADGERVVYLARDDNGKTACVIASEPRKQPRYGGTSCEVVTKPMDEELAFKSQRIADALDLVGLCELAFLKDAAGQWRMLEVNPRPWLQIGLARAAGVPLARQASLALAGHSVDRSLEAFIGVRWASIELLLISAMSGNYGSRWRECAYAISVLRQANSLAIYSTESPGVRWRWWLRLLSRLFTKWGHES